MFACYKEGMSHFLAAKEIPHLLTQIPNPPKKLYYRGDLEVFGKTCVSVVGTRQSSNYGMEMTDKIISELSLLDIAVVSGLAKGIDAVAHKSALENNLPTIAVLGSGLGNIYPQENKELADKIIASGGLLLSEYPDTAPPISYQFPQRNRIISGLSIATIVVEASGKSGALITAQFAVDQGREVFVIPGDVDRKTSQGPLQLLQKGLAYPISSGQDILAFLKEQSPLFSNKTVKAVTSSTHANPSSHLTAEQNLILQCLSQRRGLDFDRLLQQTDLPVHHLLSAISSLELLNLITQKQGLYFNQ